MKELRLLSVKVFILFLVISQLSCVRDNLGGNIKTSTTGEEVTVTFLMDSPGSLFTRAVSTPSENYIETLDILAFSAETSTQEFVYRATNIQIEDTSNDSIKKVTATVIKKDYPQCFVLIANANDQIEKLEPLTPGMNKEALLKALLYSRKQEWSGNSKQFTPIPMWGETSELTIADVNPEFSTKLLRMAARIDVYLAEDIKSVNLSGLRVYRANSQGYIVPARSNLISAGGENSYKAQSPTLPPDPLKLTDPLIFSTEAATGMLPSVYLFEAAAGTSLEDATCMIVEALYEDDTLPTYYRVDFVTLDDNGAFEAYQPILRNHRYVFNIISVDGRGYTTAEEALESEGYNMGVKLYVWDQGEISEFVFNSSYVLGVSQKEFNLHRPESINELIVTTDYKKGWKATVDDTLYPWLTVVSGVFTGVNNKDPLSFRVDENKDGQKRTGYIEVTAGTLKQTITVNQNVDDEVYLLITDEQGISTQDLLFIRYPGFNAPTQQKVKVSWSPSTSDISVLHKDHTPVGFHYGSGDNISSFSTLSAGNHEFTIHPAAFTDVEIESDPFIEKTSMAQFVHREGSKMLVENLRLRHVSYDLAADLDDMYYLNGTIQNMTVRSNVSWTAEFKTNNIVDQLITKHGGNDLAGEIVEFKMENDPDKLIDTGTATIVFTCTTEQGDTFIKEYEIKAMSEDPEITGANTYLVKPGGNKVSIPINWANKDGVKRILPTDNVEVTFIWTDNSAGMSPSGVVRNLEITGVGVNRELVVTSGSAIGNAVVGVTVGGVLKWSWLIWSTDYDPNNGGATYSANGFTVMDRNLGALTNQMDVIGALGLYFQWGRKDPIIYPDVIYYVVSGIYPHLEKMVVYDSNGDPMNFSISSASLSGNVELGIQNPLVFYTGTRSGNESYLWKDKNGNKGTQDPCPEGWRLPPNSTTQSLWTGVSKTFNNGDKYVTISGLGPWQLSGYIVASAGESQGNYTQLGLYAMMWSNDVSANGNGNGVQFAAGGLTDITYQRGAGVNNGAPLRCVKEY